MAFLLFLGFFLSSCNSWNVKEPIQVVQNYPFAAGSQLELFTSGGSITVQGEPGLDEAIVEYRIFNLKDNQPVTDAEVEVFFDQLNLNLENREGRLSIAYRSPIRILGNAVSVSYVIRIPTEANVEMQTSGGSLKVENLNGRIEMQTSGGSIRIAEVKGVLEAKTSGGSIRVDGFDGRLEVNTSGGSLTFNQVSGTIHGKTSGGSIRMNEAESIASIDLHTNGGSITLSEVSLENASIKARGNRVRLNDDKNFEGLVEKDRVDGKFGDGSIPVNLRTSGGSVRINTN